MSNATTKRQALAIADLTSRIFDNGRRGMPRPGCDCEQCFGYCLIDGDKAQRDAFAKGPYSTFERTIMSEGSGRALNLDFDV